MTNPVVTKIFQFDSAHMLSGHEGLCKNLHGHTYTVEVSVRQKVSPFGVWTDGPAEGMVVDFKYLSSALKEELFSKLDHAYIYNSMGGDDEKRIAALCEELGMRTYNMGMRPTAENMCMRFLQLSQRILKDVDTNLVVTKIKVYETPTSFAEVLHDAD